MVFASPAVMSGSNIESERIAPIFIFADDDKGAVERILERLPADWFYIPVTNPRVLLKYARRVEIRAVFLADLVEYPRGGAAFLLQRLIDEVGKPVIILAEQWNAELAEKWKRIGAEDCLPHPTRFSERMGLLRNKMQALALADGQDARRKAPSVDPQ